jgi:pimeloyl-ACP methyl ester carboxylesterase
LRRWKFILNKQSDYAIDRQSGFFPDCLSNSKSWEAFTISTWNGFERHDFYFKGRQAILVKPRKPIHNSPWIWRAEFFDAFPYADIALLEQGWYLAYYKVSDMFGCPEAIDAMKDFHDFIIEYYQLNPRPVIFGFSRGGLYAFNYAVKRPDMVSVLYLDAPVLDIRSWPGGKGAGKGDAGEWEKCKFVYGLSEETAAVFCENPLDKIEILAKAKIPIITVAGDQDDTVPFKENTAVLVEKYKKLGGEITLILKNGVSHHPHSLENPKPIVEFILSKSQLNI